MRLPPSLTRREACLSFPAALLCTTAASTTCLLPRPVDAFVAVSPPRPTLSSRLETTQLTPPSASIDSAPGELRYPAWLSGEWSATCTSAGFTAPIGDRSYRWGPVFSGDLRPLLTLVCSQPEVIEVPSTRGLGRLLVMASGLLVMASALYSTPLLPSDA